MKSFDDLFGTNENLKQANANGGEIREIPLASLHTFKNHPFQIHEDKLGEMLESVRQYGELAYIFFTFPSFLRRQEGTPASRFKGFVVSVIV